MRILIREYGCFGLSRACHITDFSHGRIASWPITTYVTVAMLERDVLRSVFRRVASMNPGIESHSVHPLDGRTMRIREIYGLFARNQARRPDGAAVALKSRRIYQSLSRPPSKRYSSSTLQT